MQTDQIRSTVGVDSATLSAVEQVYRAWDAALKAKDVETAVALYADDVRLESPLVRHLTDSQEGVIDGRQRLREFIRLVFARTPANRGHFRTGSLPMGTGRSGSICARLRVVTKWISSSQWRSTRG